MREEHDVVTTYLRRTGLETAPGGLQNHLFLFGEDGTLLVSLSGRLALVGFVVGHDDCVESGMRCQVGRGVCCERKKKKKNRLRLCWTLWTSFHSCCARQHDPLSLRLCGRFR